MKKAKRYFNTSGPCFPIEHYTLRRRGLIEKGMDLVKRKRYFTIWAPRQSGKSTYFTLLCDELKKQDYISIWITVEGFESDYTKEYSVKVLVRDVNAELKRFGQAIQANNYTEFLENLGELPKKVILVIDEIERFTKDYLNEFLHEIRKLYHKRDNHNLVSTVLVGVSNILGIIQDNASPFNIADNLEVPYFTKEETYELLGQHEKETGQRFAVEVKEKIYRITQGQPGLVNGFAYKLVDNNSDKDDINLEDYYEVEHWYLYVAIDKNIENIKHKAKRYKRLIEELLFTEKEIKFDTDQDSIKFLHTNGVIRVGKNKNIEFWVPLYKKRLFKAFSPDFNGEENYFYGNKDPYSFFDEEKSEIKLDQLINNFKDYVKRRSFKYFMERKSDGSYERLKEAAAGYAFSTYIENFVRMVGGQIYYEADSGLGKTDMLINASEKEYIIEFKVFIDGFRFREGKKQISYYVTCRGLKEGYYIVFAASRYKKIDYLIDNVTEINGITLHTYIIWYDEKKDF